MPISSCVGRREGRHGKRQLAPERVTKRQTAVQLYTLVLVPPGFWAICLTGTSSALSKAA